MLFRNPDGALTDEEKRVAKALLADGWRNQDIQALLNIGRDATINSARITEVKQDDKIEPALSLDVEFFQVRKNAFDPRTGLNTFDDERLIRAREAMMLAVQIFNSPTLNFKSEIFSVLANIAWTYLLHEHYERKKVAIADQNGNSLLLSQMLKRADCPLSKGTKHNLDSIKAIRDDVEHKLLRRSDQKWLPLFQACCLNFDRVICDLFGNELSLQKELSFAIQFARLNVEQISTLQSYEIPQHIEALDARIKNGMSDEELADIEYQFRVVFTLDSSSKGKAHIQFVHPESEEAKQIRNVLVKYKTADDLYPHKPRMVVRLVAERSKKNFTSHNHTQAWRKYQCRPLMGTAHPENTNKDYCIYHRAHGDYTYSEKWVEFLLEEISTEKGFAAIKGTQLQEG